jgi:tetratricopeptide (TPR) repeat protein
VKKLGHTYPHLLSAWLTRIADLADDPDMLAQELDEPWSEDRAEIERLLSEKRLDEAQAALDVWKPLADAVLDWPILMARVFSAAGAAGAAIEVLERSLDRSPKDSRMLALLARLLLESGRFDDGLIRLQEAVSVNPQTATLWEEVGDVLMSSGDYGGASTAYERCLTALPSQVSALRKIGDCYLHSGQPQAAKAAYEAVLQRCSEDSLARTHLAKAEAMERLLALRGSADLQREGT